MIPPLVKGISLFSFLKKGKQVFFPKKKGKQAEKKEKSDLFPVIKFINLVLKGKEAQSANGSFL